MEGKCIYVSGDFYPGIFPRLVSCSSSGYSGGRPLCRPPQCERRGGRAGLGVSWGGEREAAHLCWRRRAAAPAVSVLRTASRRRSAPLPVDTGGPGSSARRAAAQRPGIRRIGHTQHSPNSVPKDTPHRSQTGLCVDDGLSMFIFYFLLFCMVNQYLFLSN